jgi:radical SAM family RiPP maturation amino acid epimerase
MTRQSASYYRLLGDLSDVPAEYIRDVSHMKRFLERWTMDPKYQDAFASDPEAALTALGIELTPAEVIPLMDREAAMEATRLVRAGRAAEVPPAVLRYRYFIHEKVEHRRRQRAETVPGDPRLRAWRERMINRCIGELGQDRADQIVHAPVALELSKGCTVGCWFCGVAAPKFEHTWKYTVQNGRLWRECLGVVAEVYGIAARRGFLYWATDPLDNPDYEHFLTDFYDVFGVCPQTTTAQGQKDIERTRRVLQLAHSLGSPVDRFSIIALNSLYRVHEGFTPEELLRVECVPQNKESAAAGRVLKSNAGRARKFAAKRGNELVSEEQSSTIACVSGFLFNMVDRTVKLISPCNASDRWPLGYWVIAQGTFDTADELRDLMRSMIDETIRDSLGVLDTVRLRRDVRIVVGPERLRVVSMGLGLAFENQPQADELAELLAAGTYTVEQIALRRRQAAGVPPAETLAVLDRLFLGGFFDEEPPASESPAPENTAPETTRLLQLTATGRPAE